MNFAIIEKGVCSNVIVAEESFAAQIGAVALPEGYGIGDLFDGTAWTKKPVPELAEAELRQLYADLTVQYIRERYSENDEAKVMREYLANFEGAQANFSAYNQFVIGCKQKAHIEIYGN